MLSHQFIVRVKLFFGFILIVSTASSQVRILDDQQRVVVLPSRAQRIISLAPSITETLFAIGAGNQIVGVTNYCNYPEEAKSKQKVGGIVNPNIETIISLKPDVILLSMEGNVRNDFEKLTSCGVPVFVTNPRNLKGIYKSLEQLGVLTDKNENADVLVKAMKSRVDSIVKNVASKKKKSVLFFVSLQPIIVVGKNTFLHELLERAGGANAATKAKGAYPQYSREAVLKDNPDVLIFLSDVLPPDLTTLFPEWANLNAIRQKRIFRVDADIVSRPGPRVVDGLKALFGIFHENHE